jgi:hypothetical protein
MRFMARLHYAGYAEHPSPNKGLCYRGARVSGSLDKCRFFRGFWLFRIARSGGKDRCAGCP